VIDTNNGEETDMAHTASGAFESGVNGDSHRRGCSGGLKARWSIWEILAMVAGFVVFWPLGLLALFLKWKNGEMWRGASSDDPPWKNVRKPDFSHWQRGTYYSKTGNAAFDEYKRKELEKLEEQRKKLDEEQRAFGDFLERLRRAKDQEEFDRFMAERREQEQRPQPEQPSPQS
jgi:hypothetical protein